MTGSGSATQLWVGIGAGLLSGASMSLAYLISRHHTLSQPSASRGRASIDLLVRAHVIMGLVCAPAAVWLRPHDPSTLRGCLPALAAAAGLYLVGNVVFIGLLRRTEASRLTPFLGLKIFMLAMAVAFVLREPLTGRQWVAVALCIAATALLQGTAGGLSWRAFGQVLIVCLSFALSDLFIVRLIDALDAGGAPAERGRFTAALLAMLLNYVVCGIACGLVLVGRRGGAAPAADGWRAAAIYSATWLVAMATLYVCFGCVGAVLGNVVQSTRGIMSVVFGAALAHLGWHELEQRVDRATLLRRVGAAALMTAAIAVYVF